MAPKNVNYGGQSWAIHKRFSALEENENPFSSIRPHLKNPLRKILIFEISQNSVYPKYLKTSCGQCAIFAIEASKRADLLKKK